MVRYIRYAHIHIGYFFSNKYYIRIHHVVVCVTNVKVTDGGLCYKCESY